MNEPIAWLCKRKSGGSLFVYTEEQLLELGYGNISVPPFDKVAPLYTGRTWVDLPIEEIDAIIEMFTGDPWTAAMEIQSRLKERNT